MIAVWGCRLPLEARTWYGRPGGSQAAAPPCLPSAPLGSERPEGPRPLPAQSESEQRPHKLSYYCDAKGAEAEALIKQLEERLAAAGVRAKVPEAPRHEPDLGRLSCSHNCLGRSCPGKGGAARTVNAPASAPGMTGMASLPVLTRSSPRCAGLLS